MTGSFRRQIMGLGFTFEQAAQTTVDYMRTQGTMSKQGLSDVNTVRQGVLEYAMQLDMLAKTTGKQRDQIQKELQDLQIEEVWQNFLAQLSPQEASRATAAVNAQLQYGGKEAAKSLMLAFQGINVPINEASTAIEVATNGMLTTTNEQVTAAVKAGRSVNEITMMVAQNNAMMGRSAQQFQRAIGGVAGMMSQSGSPLIMATGQMTLTARNFNEVQKGLIAANSQQAKQASGTAAQFAENEARLRDLGIALNQAWNGIVMKFTPSIVSIGMSVVKLVENISGNSGFIKAINAVVNWLVKTLGDLTSSNSVGDFWHKLTKNFSEGFEALWKYIKPIWENTIKPAAISMFNSIIEFLTPFMRKAFNYVFDTVKAYVYDITGGRFGSSKQTNREISSELEYYEEARDKVAQLQRRVKELDNGDARNKVELNKIVAETIEAKVRVKKIYDAMVNGTEIPGFTRSPEAQRILEPGGPGITDSQGLFLQEIKNYLMANPPDQRSLGTLGALGSSTEPKDVLAQIHQGERVLSQGEVGSLNGMGEALQRLNSLTAQLVIEMKENNRHAKGTLDATKSLSGNSFS
jgi:hypothetical protein